MICIFMRYDANGTTDAKYILHKCQKFYSLILYCYDAYSAYLRDIFIYATSYKLNTQDRFVVLLIFFFFIRNCLVYFL